MRFHQNDRIIVATCQFFGEILPVVCAVAWEVAWDVSASFFYDNGI